ncbi:MAG: hypothetical protein ABL308_08690 [Oceanicaulis sp.]
MTSHSAFAYREPAALSALLGLDWRLRGVLTDAELGAALAEAPAAPTLRQLQRLGLVKAEHGVRPQGGRMRLWSLEAALRMEIALSLAALTGVSLTRAARAVSDRLETVDRIASEVVETGCCETAASDVREGDLTRALDEDEALERFARNAVCDFLSRNRFKDAARPAFLL